MLSNHYHFQVGSIWAWWHRLVTLGIKKLRQEVMSSRPVQAIY